SIFIFILFLTSGYSCKSDKKEAEAVPAEPASELNHENEAEPVHSVLTLKKQPFSFVIRTGGRILVDSKDIVVITAKSSGIVKFSDHFIFPGVRALKGQRLFTLSGEQLAEDNTELRFMQIKSDLEKASANYERAKSLISDRIITQENFLGVKNEYEKVLNEYNNLNSTFGATGNSISSPENGYIREIYVTEGQKISTGEPLASIVMDHNLVLKADLSPDHLDVLSSIEKANFTVGYSKRLFKTDELDGKKISFGKSTGENSFYIPVYFRMNSNPELIEGTFAEVYLIGKEIRDAIVVPNSALLEEFGKLYVFVEDEDGDFLKRYVVTGSNNGEFTEVTGGLAENESIVATGAYNIKLSQMSGSAPAHTHNH
ncbi:MAG: efflux RND transporter periplasmic adaptor subunit, partial [Bacteroidales bacterium]